MSEAFLATSELNLSKSSFVISLLSTLIKQVYLSIIIPFPAGGTFCLAARASSVAYLESFSN